MNRIKSFLRRFATQQQQSDASEQANAPEQAADTTAMAAGPYGQGYAGFLANTAAQDPYYGPALGLHLRDLAGRESAEMLRQAQQSAEQARAEAQLKADTDIKQAYIAASTQPGVPFGLFTDPLAPTINPVLGTIANNINFARGAAEAQSTGANTLKTLRDAGIDASPELAQALVYDPVTQTNFPIQRFSPDGLSPGEVVQVRGQDVDVRGQDIQLAIARIMAATRMQIAALTGRDPGQITVDLTLGPGNIITGAEVSSRNPQAAATAAQQIGPFIRQHNRQGPMTPLPPQQQQNRGGIR